MGLLKENKKVTYCFSGIVVLVLFFGGGQIFASQAAPLKSVDPAFPWKVKVAELAMMQEDMEIQLEIAHAWILERVQKESPALLEQLSPAPPKAIPYGYGRLPKINPDAPSSFTQPRETRYSLRTIIPFFQPDVKAITLLAAANADTRIEDLPKTVDEFKRLKGRFRLLGQHLGYHRHWQQAVIDYAKFFENKNVLVRQVRDWVTSRQEKEPLPEDVLHKIVIFRGNRTLKGHQQGEAFVLPVPIYTDIAHGLFLGKFKRSVEAVFNDSEAAKKAKFEVRLTFHRLSAKDLYGEAFPKKGDHLDLSDHLKRFPKEGLSLTTGGTSTRAFQGHHVVLGPHPMTPRVITHEFCHLLGFNDAYLRGFDGKPTDEFGSVLVEWTGLQDDLMGNPGGGVVTEQMVRMLLDSYFVKELKGSDIK